MFRHEKDDDDATGGSAPPAPPADNKPSASDEAPAWARGIIETQSKIMSRLDEEREPEKMPPPGFSKRGKADDADDDDDPFEIVSVEEIVEDVKDAVEDAADKIAEPVHALFRSWGGKR
jgi:hypothetical protein